MVALTTRVLNEAVDSDGAPTDAYIGLLNAVHKLGREQMAERWTAAKRQVAEDSFSFCNATQVGPLELIRELNALADDFADLWGAPANSEEALAASQRTQARMGIISVEIERRWFHRYGEVPADASEQRQTQTSG